MMNTYREQDLVRVLHVTPTGSDGVYGAEAQTHLQERIDILPSVIYQGTAARGAAPSDEVWTIKRVELDAAGNPSTLQWADTAIWDNRTTETYS